MLQVLGGIRGKVRVDTEKDNEIYRTLGWTNLLNEKGCLIYEGCGGIEINQGIGPDGREA